MHLLMTGPHYVRELNAIFKFCNHYFTTSAYTLIKPTSELFLEKVTFELSKTDFRYIPTGKSTKQHRICLLMSTFV